MWKVLNRQVLHDAMPWVRLTSEHVRLPNGVEIEDFYRVDINPYVMMFAITEEGHVALIEHYKHGPEAVSLELPAGYIENNDNPLDTARRAGVRRLDCLRGENHVQHLGDGHQALPRGGRQTGYCH